MPPRRSAQDSAAPFWLGVTAVSAVVATASWAWYSLRGATAADGEAAAPVGKAKRSGPKPTLALAASVLPPTWLISRVAEDYNLHLIFPARSPFPFPAQYTATSIDPRQLLFHETPEGLTHVARVVGGILVYACPGVEGDALPTPDDVGEVDLQKLEQDTKAFVRDFVVVGGGETTNDGKAVKGWEGLAQLLRV